MDYSPFWTLPQELRDIVYEHALTFRENGRCDPQLLATCRRINREATSIFRNNSIRINILEHAIFVHGVGYNKYLSQGDWHRMSRYNYTTIRWPAFLRRVHKIHISLSKSWFGASGSLDVRSSFGSRHALMDNILFSLCSFLQSNHCISTVCIELEDGSLGSNSRRRVDIHALKLLGVPVLQPSQHVNVHDPPTYQMRDGSSMNVVVQQRLTTSATELPFRGIYCDATRIVAGEFRQASLVLMDHTGTGAAFNERLIWSFKAELEYMGIYSHHRLTKLGDLHALCQRLRIVSESLPLPVDQMFSDVMARLLRLDIDLMVAKATQW